MNRPRLKLLAISAVLTLTGAVMGDGGADKTLQEIAGYRQWTRVNEQPIVVERSLLLAAGG